MAFTYGPFALAGGAEAWFWYWFGPAAAPYWVGPKLVQICPPLAAGGSFIITAQGIRNIGTGADQRIQYLVRVKNLGSTGSFYIRGE